MKSITFHIAFAVRKEGQPISYTAIEEPHYYTKSSAEKALRAVLADHKRRGVELANDEFAIVKREQGEEDSNFDYWRKVTDCLPPVDERVLVYCESEPMPPLIEGRWVIVIARWDGESWKTDERKKPFAPVRFWMSLPDSP
jgi:hypothetical protein